MGNRLEQSQLDRGQCRTAIERYRATGCAGRSGLSDLQVVADLSGSIASPKFSVSSNLDQAIAQQLKAVIGEEVAKAEKMVRAKVDSLVADKVEPVKRQVAAVQTESTKRIQAEKQRIDEVQKQLNAELQRLTRGLAPGIELPKIKL